MIPKIDLNVFEWMMVRDYIDRKWQREKVFAVCGDSGHCLGTYNERLDCSGNPYYWEFSRPIEKKPLESAFDIPSWCFGRRIMLYSGGMTFLSDIVSESEVSTCSGSKISTKTLSELGCHIEREGFGRFNLYREVEE